MTNILLMLIAFLGMEFMAWFTHKYIMHGLLWRLHRDHHHRDNKGFFEQNDYFFLIFAIPGITLLYFGVENQLDYRFWIGMGITIYGFTYFLVHDIFIHRRFNLFRNTNNVYLKAIRKAHKVHHKYMTKEDGECFGMLVVPFKYYIEASKRVR